MDTSILVALVAGVPSVAAALFAYRSSAQATRAKAETDAEVNRIAATKVDAEAFERSQALYEKVLAAAEKEVGRLQSQVDRLHDQLDRVNDQLAREQDVSNTLRNHVRTLQAQVTTMEQTLTALRIQISPQRGASAENQQRAEGRYADR